MTVEGEDRGGDEPGHGGQHGGDGTRGADPDGVPQRDLVAAHVVQRLGHHGHLLRRDLAFIRTTHNTGYVAYVGEN